MRALAAWLLGGAAALGQARAESVGARVLTPDAGAQLRRNPAMPWRPLQAGASIPEIAQLSCERRCLVRAGPDTSVELEPGAVVAFRDHFFVPLVPVPPMTRARQVELVRGEAKIASAERPDAMPIVLIHGSAFVAVRGGAVQVAVAEGDKVVAGVSTSPARVAMGRGWTTVEPGRVAVLDAHGPLKVSPMLGPPAFQDNPTCPQTISLAAVGASATVGACWTNVEGATAYEVEVAKDDSFEPPLERLRTNAPFWYDERGAVRGSLRVRGIDRYGVRGEVSEARPFAVVPVRLAPGAVLDARSRTLMLAEGARVAFPERTGLEVEIDEGGFVTLPESLSMDAEGSHSVRLRFKGHERALGVFRFERPALEALIQLEPKTARWPHNPIEIRVLLQDPSGRWDVNHLKPEFEVLVGMTAVRLDWVHDGPLWMAHLAPRDLGAPTVVRVVAKDEYGRRLGRNFLEVAYGQPSAARGSRVASP